MVKGEDIASYRAVLQTPEGQVILEKEGLRARSSRRGVCVKLLVSADQIGDSFKLTLQGKAADGIEIAQDYYINVVRK